jgi:hypothetical protein
VSTADLSELICPECDRPCDDHASDCPMPDGERVTTGSEPRRWTLAPDMTDDPPLPYACAGPMLRPDERVEVQEVVEPGHDEQTEALLEQMRGWYQPEEVVREMDYAVERVVGYVRSLGGQRYDPNEIADGIEQKFPTGDKAEPWRPDPRTVAAVVEALRGEHPAPDPEHSASWGAGWEAATVLVENRFLLAERFKPSAPGGALEKDDKA